MLGVFHCAGAMRIVLVQLCTLIDRIVCLIYVSLLLVWALLLLVARQHTPSSSCNAASPVRQAAASHGDSHQNKRMAANTMRRSTVKQWPQHRHVPHVNQTSSSLPGASPLAHTSHKCLTASCNSKDAHRIQVHHAALQQQIRNLHNTLSTSSKESLDSDNSQDSGTGSQAPAPCTTTAAIQCVPPAGAPTYSSGDKRTGQVAGHWQVELLVESNRHIAAMQAHNELLQGQLAAVQSVAQQLQALVAAREQQLRDLQLCLAQAHRQTLDAHQAFQHCLGENASAHALVQRQQALLWVMLLAACYDKQCSAQQLNATRQQWCDAAAQLAVTQQHLQQALQLCAERDGQVYQLRQQLNMVVQRHSKSAVSGKQPAVRRCCVQKAARNTWSSGVMCKIWRWRKGRHRARDCTSTACAMDWEASGQLQWQLANEKKLQLLLHQDAGVAGVEIAASRPVQQVQQYADHRLPQHPPTMVTQPSAAHGQRTLCAALPDDMYQRSSMEVDEPAAAAHPIHAAKEREPLLMQHNPAMDQPIDSKALVAAPLLKQHSALAQCAANDVGMTNSSHSQQQAPATSQTVLGMYVQQQLPTTAQTVLGMNIQQQLPTTAQTVLGMNTLPNCAAPCSNGTAAAVVQVTAWPVLLVTDAVAQAANTVPEQPTTQGCTHGLSSCSGDDGSVKDGVLDNKAGTGGQQQQDVEALAIVFSDTDEDEVRPQSPTLLASKALRQPDVDSQALQQRLRRLQDEYQVSHALRARYPEAPSAATFAARGSPLCENHADRTLRHEVTIDDGTRIARDAAKCRHAAPALDTWALSDALPMPVGVDQEADRFLDDLLGPLPQPEDDLLDYEHAVSETDEETDEYSVHENEATTCCSEDDAAQSASSDVSSGDSSRHEDPGSAGSYDKHSVEQ